MSNDSIYDDYYEKLEDFYNDMLISMNGKDDVCKGCDTKRKFIFQNVDGKVSLIYTCGKDTSNEDSDNDCGPLFEIVLPTSIDYNKKYESLYDVLNFNIDYNVLKKYINFKTDYEKKYSVDSEEFELLKNSFKSINNIVDKQKQCDKLKEIIETLKKDNFVLIDEIKNSEGDTKTQKIKDYIRNNNEIQKSNIKLKEILSSIKNILILKPPEIKQSDIDIVENTNDDSTSDKLIKKVDKQLSDEGWPKYEPESPPLENTNDDSTSDKEDLSKDDEDYLNDITDITKYNKTKDFNYSKARVKECEQSVGWKRLDKAENSKEYLEILKQIQTNPKFPSFNQIYFHAGDSLQYEKYSYLKTRLLSYPKNYEVSDNKMYEIYQDYNIDSTYQTFQYLFQKLKKGIYISFRNGKLDVFLPFSNFNYHNNWSKILRSKNKGLFNKMLKDPKNLSDASRWYANNCFFNTERYKYTEKSKDFDYKEFLVEGDKTVIPLKYFLIYFEKYCNNNNLNIPDVDYFFSPRDFPVLRQDYLEPYDKIFPNKKLSDKYIHKNYTPILSQSGNIKYHDIPVPTEDDMLRISPDIYPDSCKNNYNDIPKFDIEWENKIDVCVFRGSATGCGITIDTNMRLKAAHLSYKWKKEGSFKNNDGMDVLDAKLTTWNKGRPKIDNDVFQTLNPRKFKFSKDVGKQNFMDILEQSKHKYILNIDGHVKAFRLGNEMRMGSVVLLVDSPYTLWFQKYMKHKVHYVQIKSDLSDLHEQLEWCLKNDDMCKEIAINAKILYDKYLSREGTYMYYYNLINDLSKIRKPIIPDMNDNSLSLIVAYRDPGDGSRKAQLDIFLKQMQTILETRTNYHIYIIEQESDRNDYNSLSDEYKQIDSKMAKFNLGRIKNIGFQIASKDNKDIDNHYYILSDVDLIPSMDLLKDYLRYPKKPIHLANRGTRYNLDGKNEDFLGGVLSINKEDFTKSNGYPNNFWGWGGEDDVLSSRLRLKNIDIDKPEESVIDLEEMTFEEKNIILKQNKYKEMQKWEKSCIDNNILYEKYKKHCKNITNKDTYKKNGINSIKKLYTITERNNTHKVSHIKVFLNIDENDTFESIKSDTPKSDTPKSDTPKSDTQEDIKRQKLNLEIVEEYDKPLSLVNIYNLSKNYNLDELVIVGVETDNFKRVMKYLNNNIWLIKYIDTDLLRQLLDNDYYGMGSGKLNETVVNVLNDKNLLYPIVDGLSPKTQSDEPSSKEKSKSKSDDIIVVGSKVEFNRKDDKIVGEVIEFTTKRDKCRICCKPGKTKTDSGAFYMVPVDKLTLIKESSDTKENVEKVEDVVEKDVVEENIIEENRNDSPSKNIIVGSNVKWTKNGKILTGKVERITKTSYKICCKPGKSSGEKGSLYMVPINDVQLN